ncbi:GNAT family N-acetyltransferase [Brachybacterium timonense]|uniref:GNAT family N-acetyltransferase n=1 Tax=Brachybacterium timonense TaxID=2050896 RepID=UPI000D0B7317|nr:GNAT family N-acetyltransferase [Brachybacterium timonense]
MPGPILTISPLRQADAAVLGPLHVQLWHAAYTGLLSQARLDGIDPEHRTRAWEQYGQQHEANGRTVDGSVVQVARNANGTPIGWAAVGPPRDADAPSETELWSLYVAQEHWGSGVAHTLITTVLGERPAYLYVLQGNERAIRFYRRHGFTLDGATKLLDPDDGPRGGIELRMVRG